MHFGLRNRYIIPILKQWCKEAHVSHCSFKYDSDTKTLTIYTDKPGWMIGLHGDIVNKYKRMFCEDNEVVKTITFKEVDGAI